MATKSELEVQIQEMEAIIEDNLIKINELNKIIAEHEEAVSPRWKSEEIQKYAKDSTGSLIRTPINSMSRMDVYQDMKNSFGACLVRVRNVPSSINAVRDFLDVAKACIELRSK